MSLVSKFGKHTVIDQNPNNIDLSTKNKVHASLVLHYVHASFSSKLQTDSKKKGNPLAAFYKRT